MADPLFWAAVVALAGWLTWPLQREDEARLRHMQARSNVRLLVKPYDYESETV